MIGTPSALGGGQPDVVYASEEWPGSLVILAANWAQPAVHIASVTALSCCRLTLTHADLATEHPLHLAALRARSVLINSHYAAPVTWPIRS